MVYADDLHICKLLSCEFIRMSDYCLHVIVFIRFIADLIALILLTAVPIFATFWAGLGIRRYLRFRRVRGWPKTMLLSMRVKHASGRDN